MTRLTSGDIIEFDMSLIGRDQSLFSRVYSHRLVYVLEKYIFDGFVECEDKHEILCNDGCEGLMSISDLKHNKLCDICASWNGKRPIRVVGKNFITKIFNDILEEI